MSPQPMTLVHRLSQNSSQGLACQHNVFEGMQLFSTPVDAHVVM